jgi:hypothetical protein
MMEALVAPRSIFGRFPRNPSGGLDRRGADGLIGEIDRYLSAELDRVMHHPEFVRVEQAWRGLKFLIDRIDFREPVRVEIASSTPGELPGLLEKLAEEPAPEAPVASIVTDSGPELEELRRAAEAAAILGAAHRGRDACALR